MRVNNIIYNHLSSELTPKKSTSTHKSSELKNLYHNIAKYNKNSPLYLLSMSDSKQTRMINIKEAAVTLKDISDCMSDPDSQIYKNKVAVSDAPDYVSVSLSKSDFEEMPGELTIDVLSLAREQINTGNYLENNRLGFRPGNYSFTLETISGDANISFSVARGITNEQLQTELVKRINSATVGVNASLVNDGKASAIMLASNETGVPSTRDGLHFSISDADDGELIKDVLGLHNVTQTPANSNFKINNEPHTSASNNISINQTIELDFHKPTGSPVRIALTNDSSLIKEQMTQFIGAYNSLVKLGASSSNSVGARSLKHDISSITSRHIEELNAAGIAINEEGYLNEASGSYSFDKLFDNISSFKNDVNKAVDKIALDPVAYINKLIVTYPNVENKSGNSYTDSVYSGLLFNNYA